MLLINEQWIKEELGTLYGDRVVREIEQINTLYSIYDGPGQEWTTPGNLKYKPNKTVTNYIKKLIKAEARFFCSRAPEIKFKARDQKDADACEQLDDFLGGVLDASHWQGKLIKAARDCFIGKRVALKLSGEPGKPLRVDFRPAQEFVFDTADDDTDALKKIIFFYQIAGEKVDETDKEKQRIWCQKYELRDGRCYLSQGLFDGNGTPVGGDNITDKDTGLDFIPCTVILNDGLTGDVSGESDVEALLTNQDTYNHANSDDADALKFSMFPMRYTVDASAESAEKLEISPGAYADITSDSSGMNNQQAKMGILESQFSYDQRLENRLNRTKNDMHDLLSVPNVSLEQLKGLAQSGKGMRAIYWELRCRCEEKWAEGWDDALRWMAGSLVKMARQLNVARLPEVDYSIAIDHLYPIPEDEEDERVNDMAEVKACVRSHKSYIDKWQPDGDADGELQQIAAEQAMLEDGYTGRITRELEGEGTSPAQEGLTEGGGPQARASP